MSVHLGKYRKLITGVIIGLLCTLSAGALASAPGKAFVSALLDADIAFQFDGQWQVLPEGYTVLTYNNRTYVPARFVAENLGAKVQWDGITKTIRINTVAEPCAECLALQKEKETLEQKVQEQEEKIKALEKEIKELEALGEGETRSPGQPEGNYQKLPLSRVLPDMNISVTGMIKDEHYNIVRVYLEVENKKSTPLQLLHTQTKAIVDGEEYKTWDVRHFTLDQRWYHNIDEEEVESGYIILPALPEDSKEMLLQLTVLHNDAAQKITTVEFAISLDS